MAQPGSPVPNPQITSDAGRTIGYPTTRFLAITPPRLYYCVYDKDYMSAPRINNTSESDPCSFEVTSKAQKKLCGSKGIRTHDLRDSGAMLYRLSYEASPEAGQVRVQFITVI